MWIEMVAAELEGKKSRLQPIVKEVKEKHERKEKKDRNRKSPLKRRTSLNKIEAPRSATRRQQCQTLPDTAAVHSNTAMQQSESEVNVRVAVRVRPLLPKEKLGGEQSVVRVVHGSNQLVVGKDRGFTFDNVISPKTPQDEVYTVCVEPLVKSVFEGYNATVFAYGQTGSGKTYTIGGGHVGCRTDEELGAIPRAIKHMFDKIKTNSEIEYTTKVSYIEIYKEELRDLLDSETSSKDIHIREDEKGNTVIMGHREVECETLDEVMSCIESGSSVRHTGSTQMNEHSSRSHSIFTIFVEQRWSGDSEGQPQTSRRRKESEESESEEEVSHYMCSKFHFVDLAGSERAHKTGNVGDRFKESVHINSGLLALGNVISALGDPKRKIAHIPYRDSKITRLLKDSLGGNAKTLMICCISPSSASFDESLNSLKYANRARNIRNKPVVNRDIQSIRFEEMQTEIKALREELARQRTTLFTAGPVDQMAPKMEQEMGHLRELEEQVIRLQTESSHYRVVAEEAYKQLMDIQTREMLSKSQNVRLRDWMELMEEMKSKVPASLNKEDLENKTIAKLQTEIKRLKQDLKNDEEIFSEKSKVASSLQQRIDELKSENAETAARLEELLERNRQQEQTLIAQQVKIQEMQPKPKSRHLSVESSQEIALDTLDVPPITSRRAKSVPASMLKRREENAQNQLPPPRNIHTSPALFSLERVMQGFRARSQLLANRLEDNDEVQHKQFSEDSINSEDGADNDKENRNSGEKQRKPLVRRGTFKKEGARVLQRSCTDDEKLQMQGDGEEEEEEEDDKKKNKIKFGQTIKGFVSRLPQPAVKVSREKTEDVNSLRASSKITKQQIKKAQLRVVQANQQMRDLGINIKMKEQLIRELAKTGKEAKEMNMQYQDKISKLERECSQAKKELLSAQRALQGLEQREQHEESEKNKLQSEYRKKLETAKHKVHTLVRKQKETEKMVNLTDVSEKRMHDLEMNIGRMRQDHELLQKKLKEEQDRKMKLEKDMQKEQQRIKELEIRNEQQQKVLKIKTEEVVAAKRKLRTGTVVSPPRNVTFREPDESLREEQKKVEEQKRWLDGEIEKVLQQKQQVENVQEELKRRELYVDKREQMLEEKSRLEMKKLRSSQILSKDIVSVANKLESVERKMEEKNEELSASPEEKQLKHREELKSLQQGRERLLKQRHVLEDKLHEGTLLSPEEERRLIELDEGVEALDEALEYKNNLIANRKQELRKSQMLTQSEGNLLSKLNAISAAETKSLLVKYFDKVVDLKEGEKKKDYTICELEMKVDEQERLLDDLQMALQHSAMDAERKLVQQQKDYEQKMQLLMRQLNESSTGGSSSSSDLKSQQLEKDLYYYKKTSRDLKKKLRELIAGTGIMAQEPDRDDDGDGSSGSSILTAREPRSAREGTPSSSVAKNTPRGHDSQYNGSASARGTPRHSSVGREQEAPPSARILSARSERSSHLGDGDVGRNIATPVKISRRELRKMSDDEVQVRRSNVAQTPASVQDSLDAGQNPWAQSVRSHDRGKAS